MALEVLHTKDGSTTLFNTELQASYHSTNGALQESEHIYIGAGLNYVVTQTRSLRVLEFGFGTGLNALLTFRESEIHDLNIEYLSLEKLPLEEATIAHLHFEIPRLPAGKDLLIELHRLPWNETHQLSPRFSFHKRLGDAQHFVPQELFHVVYFDAFAPANNPELWTETIFKRLYEHMFPGACLVSFCAKGEVKRALKRCGFQVESLPGPAGKLEITRALKL